MKVDPRQLQMDFEASRTTSQPRQAKCRARRTDPVGSHVAAQRHERSGLAGTQRGQVARALETFGACTAKELAAQSGLDRYMISRRLPELREMGVVASVGHRAGSKETVWQSVPLHARKESPC